MNSKYLLFGAVLAGLPFLTSAGAATPQSVNIVFTVNSVADSVDANPGDAICADASGQCSLRAAIMEANAQSGADTIQFDSATTDGQPILLQLQGAGEDAAATGDLDITKALTITGNGSGKTIIDGNGTDRVFDINPGGLASFAVQIDGVTIQNGKDATAGLGGGIRVQTATLALDNDLIQNNQTTLSGSTADGGGIYGIDATVTVNNTTVTGNSATSGLSARGGGIAVVYNSATAGKLSVLNGSIISANTATGGTSGVNGGGIYYDAALPLVMDSSALRGNKAIDTTSSQYAYGGGLSINSTSYTITNSEISGNSTQGDHGTFGGGIDSENSKANSAIVNTTISGNTATVTGTSGTAYGGGISVGPQSGITDLLANVTISGNTVDSTSTSGGGLNMYYASTGTVLVRNSLIASNTDTASATPDCYAPSVTSGGYNLVGDNTGCSFPSGTGDQIGSGSSPIDPMLGALAANGGSTQTMALIAGSPAVDAGNPAGCTGASGSVLATDQRGDTRPTDGNGDGNITCDIGAYERGTESGPTVTDGSLTTNAGTAATGTLTATDADGDALKFAIASQPAHGTLTLTSASKGTFSYTPASGYSGTDSFTFTANDGYLDSNAGTESISIKATSSGSTGGGGGGGGGGGLNVFALIGLLLTYVAASARYRKRLQFKKC